MIASDYLRCAPSDQEAAKRYDQIRHNVAALVYDTVQELLNNPLVRTEDEAADIIADRVIAHFRVSCYLPGKAK